MSALPPVLRVARTLKPRAQHSRSVPLLPCHVLCLPYSTELSHNIVTLLGLLLAPGAKGASTYDSAGLRDILRAQPGSDCTLLDHPPLPSTPLGGPSTSSAVSGSAEARGDNGGTPGTGGGACINSSHRRRMGPQVFVVAASVGGSGPPQRQLFRNYPDPNPSTGSIRSLKQQQNGEDLFTAAAVEASVRIWEAGMATSAAPTFFPQVQIQVGDTAAAAVDDDGDGGGGGGGRCSYVDGGLVANNPVETLLEEVEQLWPDRQIGCIVSLGCGRHADDDVRPSGESGWLTRSGAAGGWAEQISLFHQITEQLTDTQDTHLRVLSKLNIPFDGTSATADADGCGATAAVAEQRQNFLYGNVSTNPSRAAGMVAPEALYLRLNPPLHRRMEMDCTDPQQLDLLRQGTLQFLHAPQTRAKLAMLSEVLVGKRRCIYGAKCYQQNPQHKAAFAHPGDPDWAVDALDNGSV